MLQQILDEFLLKKQNEWILKANKGEIPNGDKLISSRQEAESRYSSNNWFSESIEKTRMYSTHPSTFSHPDAKTTPIFFIGAFKVDGYLKSGNVSSEVHFDVFGNAATDSKVYDLIQFFNIRYSESQSVLNLFESGHDDAEKFCIESQLNFNEIQRVVNIFSNSYQKLKSSKLVKQVYFPVDDEYHLLSILTSSINLTTLKERIFDLRKSEKSKDARTAFRENKHHSEGYDELPDLTEIAFGGSKPQNVSVLNSKNRGSYYLLKSIPPNIKKRAVRLPTNDFFSQSLRTWLFKEPMQELHKLMGLDINNMKIRAAISNTIIYTAKMVLKEASTLRDTETGWSAREHYQGLEEYQRVWLDDAYATVRLEQSEWIKPLSRQFARWFLDTYEKVLSADAFTLGDQELFHVESFIMETLEADEGLLK